MPTHDSQEGPSDLTKVLGEIPIDRVPAAMVLLASRLVSSSPSPDRSESQRYLTPDEIADRYGLDRRWVYAKAEYIGAVKLGRRTIRVPEAGLLAYLDRQRMRGPLG